jgi:hypothetical protein
MSKKINSNLENFLFIAINYFYPKKKMKILFKVIKILIQ